VLVDATPTAPASDSPSRAARPPLRSQRTMWRETIEVLLLVVTVYTGVNLATARAIVEGDSMRPNFASNQLVIVNRAIYTFHGPERGDVVVLHDPEDVSVDFIKRVVGLPGEYVEIDSEGRVSINGVMLDEPYIDANNWCKICAGKWSLKANEYFVLGDNRANSHDSHIFGPIDESLIVGQAWIRYWPLDQAEIVPHQRFPDPPHDYTPPPVTPTPGRTSRPPRSTTVPRAPGTPPPMIELPAYAN